MTKRKEEGMKLSFPVSESRDHIQGLATAAVTLVEYGDYECPYCAQAYLIVETAAAQGRFWDMYDFLFKHGEVLTDDNLRQSAAKLGLNISRFDHEFLDRTYSRHLDEDIQSGKESGVTKTPTFFINEDRYDESWDLDSLLSALDEASVFSWRRTNSSV